jgi:hypothetical protein
VVTGPFVFGGSAPGAAAHDGCMVQRRFRCAQSSRHRRFTALRAHGDVDSTERILATSLSRKLGIKQGSRVLLIAPPGHYRELLAPLPDALAHEQHESARLDLARVFVTRHENLAQQRAELLRR